MSTERLKERIPPIQLRFGTNGINEFSPLQIEEGVTPEELYRINLKKTVEDHISELTTNELVEISKNAARQGLLDNTDFIENSWKEEVDRRVKEFGGNYPEVPKGFPQYNGSEAARRILVDRYLKKDEYGNVAETAEERFLWAGINVARAERHFGKSEKEVYELGLRFAEMMARQEFEPNSPTLMNAGKDNGLQYSACFVLPINDSMEGIFGSIKNAALIHKSGGGTGFPLSDLRPKDSRVESTEGKASGPVSFLKVFDAATDAVKQGGTRRGANMAEINVHHPDIGEFVNSKAVLDDETGWMTNKKIYEEMKPYLTDSEAEILENMLLAKQIANFNISVAATDEFMEAVLTGGEYDLKDPKTGKVVGKRNARKDFDQICLNAAKTGDPGMWWVDRVNQSRANPVPEVETIKATNPCGEQPLGEYDACNLGSINLGLMVKRENGHVNVDWEKLEETTKLSTRFLDDVIEVNPYTLPQIDQKVKSMRRIGLGVMGWHDMLLDLGIKYDSDEAVQLGEKVMEFINTKAFEQSAEMAQERGVFPLFNKSIYKDGEPVRNSTRTTIAPTGTISIIADASSGIEPIFSVAYLHRTPERELKIVNRKFEEVARKKGFYSEELVDKIIANKGKLREIEEIPEDVKNLFVTAHEVNYEWHIRHQSAFQKHTDNGVSKTINLPNEATWEDIKNAYLLAYNLGCQGITVYRDGSKFYQVLNTMVEKKKLKTFEGPVEPRGDAILDSKTARMRTPDGHLYVTVGEKNDEPFETFAGLGKAGQDVEGWTQAIGRMMSAGLQFNPKASRLERLEVMANQLIGIGGSRSVGFGPEKVLSGPDGLGRALLEIIDIYKGQYQKDNGYKKIEDNPKSDRENLEMNSRELEKVAGNLCGNCGNNTLEYSEGCVKCRSCGDSEC